MHHPSAPLTGEQAGNLKDILATAFAPSEFDELVFRALGRPLTNFVGPGQPHPQTVWQLIRALERESLLEPLLRAALRRRPNNMQLVEFCAELFPAAFESLPSAEPASAQPAPVAPVPAQASAPAPSPPPPPPAVPHLAVLWHEEVGPHGGWIYRGDRSHPVFVADVLVVLVHGILGHGKRTWGNVHECVLAATGLECDVFTFDYPAGWSENCDVEQGAGLLLTVLREKFGQYRHLIFLLHSTGGLLFKAAVRKEEKQFLRAELDKPDARFQQIRSMTLRTRQVFNLDVPHAGGNRWKAALGRYGYRFVIWPPLSVLVFVRRGEWPRGRNRIIDQLEFQGDYVMSLERDYVAFIEDADRRAVPRPISYEILADDTVIARYADALILDVNGRKVGVRSDAAQVAIRTKHVTIKRVRGHEDLLCGVISRRIAWWKDELSSALADATFARIDEYAGSIHFCRLLEASSAPAAVATGSTGSSAPPTSGPAVPGADLHALAQRQAVQVLQHRVAEVRDGPMRIVLTGESGLGKSLVARVLVRDVCLRYLQGPGEGGEAVPVSFLMPLQRLSADPEFVRLAQHPGTRSEAWMRIAQNWADYVNEYLEIDERNRGFTGAGAVPGRGSAAAPRPPRPRITAQWIDEQVRTRPTVLVFDAIDEFLSRNRGLSIAALSAVLSDLMQRSRANQHLTVIQVVRSTQPGIRLLSARPGDVVTLRAPTVEEAEKVFPGAQALLDAIADPALKQLLLNPMVLMTVGPALQGLTPAHLDSRSKILRLSLVARIQGAALPDPRTPRVAKAAPADPAVNAADDDADPDADDDDVGELDADEIWLDALMPIAWYFYTAQRGEASDEEIRDASVRILTDWLAHDACGDAAASQGGPSESNGDRADAEQRMLRVRLRAAQCILLDDERRRHLLANTIFFPTGERTYRLLHAQWGEFLCARFLMICIRGRRPALLGFGACTEAMFRITGELLQDFVLRDTHVDAFLTCAGRLQMPYITGNFVSVIGNSLGPLDGPAISMLARRGEAMTGIAQVVLTAGLGRRVLITQDENPLPTMLAREMQAAFRRFLQDPPPPLINSVTRSMAYCYLRQYERRFGWAAQVSKPPPLWDGHDGFGADPQALQIICGDPREGRPLSDAHRSLQTAFLQIQRTALRTSERAISLVHYIYFLALAYRVGRTIAEAELELGAVLEEDSDTAQMVREYGMPELNGVFACAQRLYAAGV